MKTIHFSYIITIFAFIISIVTRLYLLGEAPHGLYLDEAGQGYSAYSILKTGKDEFGMPYPIVFRSFTDFKTPVYIYLVVPLIPIFGLTKFAVRFPSFFFSILTIPILYFLILQLLQKTKKHTASLGNSSMIAATSSLLLAISPWHILFGRTNFECNVALLFFLAGSLAFYKGLKRPWIIILAAILFGLAIPSYHSQRIITPAILVFLFFRFRNILMSPSHIKFSIAGVIVGFIILLPTLTIATTPGFLARAAGLNIFNHSKQSPAGYIDKYNGSLSPIVNNSILLSAKEFASLYTSYFSPRTMFVLGDYGPRSSFPYLSTFFVWQFPFYIWGLYLLIKKRELGELRLFTIALLLISPIPAAVTRDPYSTIRSLPMVIPITIVIALAIVDLYKKISQNVKLKYIFWGISFLTLTYSLLKLYSSVIVLNEYYRGEHWNYGWEEISNVITQLDKNIPIVVDNSRSEPYSQLLFFLKFDPTEFQKTNSDGPLSDYYTNMDRNKTRLLGNIITRPIDWELDLLTEKYLIGDALAISEQQIKNHGLEIIADISYPDRSRAFIIVKTKKPN